MRISDWSSDVCSSDLAAQGLQQALVVALVQADGGLVQHVEHTGEARADLRGETDALALAARQAAGAAAESQVVEADVDQEAQTLVDLLQDARGDLLFLRAQLAVEGGEPGGGLGDRELGGLADVQAVDLHRQRLGLQAVAVAAVAGLVVLVLELGSSS